VSAAVDLLRAVGYGSAAGPWVAVGIGVNAGRAYVGNVGSAVVDFTALGDPINVAARLQAAAAGGQLVVAEDLHGDLPALLPHARWDMVECAEERHQDPFLSHSPERRIQHSLHGVVKRHPSARTRAKRFALTLTVVEPLV
jgi:class 3 adenylate cyclase